MVKANQSACDGMTKEKTNRYFQMLARTQSNWAVTHSYKNVVSVTMENRGIFLGLSQPPLSYLP